MLAREVGFMFIVNEDKTAFHIHQERPGAVGRALHDDLPAGQARRGGNAHVA